jgi:ubiquinone/menaquinone biosynthesis C-methylase UbiE
MYSNNYHLQELQVASIQNHPGRIMPPINGNQKRILDVGCGAGQTLIASQLAPDVTAVGVDMDIAALLLGKQLSEEIDFVCAHGEDLPLNSEYFDLVISRVAVPYMHKHIALGEMWRVLRNGGRMWIALHPFSMVAKEMLHNLTRLELKAAVHRSYVLVNGITGHFFGKELRSPFGQRGYESFQTNRSISRLLTEIGFADIRIRRDRFFVVTATKPKHLGGDGSV